MLTATEYAEILCILVSALCCWECFALYNLEPYHERDP